MIFSLQNIFLFINCILRETVYKQNLLEYVVQIENKVFSIIVLLIPIIENKQIWAQPKILCPINWYSTKISKNSTDLRWTRLEIKNLIQETREALYCACRGAKFRTKRLAHFILETQSNCLKGLSREIRTSVIKGYLFLTSPLKLLIPKPNVKRLFASYILIFVNNYRGGRNTPRTPTELGERQFYKKS